MHFILAAAAAVAIVIVPQTNPNKQKEEKKQRSYFFFQVYSCDAAVDISAGHRFVMTSTIMFQSFGSVLRSLDSRCDSHSKRLFKGENYMAHGNVLL